MNNSEKRTGDILIVDDTPNNLLLLSTLLKKHGYEVRSAINGELALQAVRASLPDLVLLDVAMPKIDGYEVCRQMKANPRTAHIPIVFISAYNEVMDKVKAFEVGGVDYITKPFQWAEVLVRVESQLKICFLQKQLQEQNLQLHQEIQERLKVEIALQAANQKLQTLANLDGLTGAANRRRFDEYIQQQWEEHKQEQKPISLILCDVDYFKHYNDTYGHLAGDNCLRELVRSINQTLQIFEKENQIMSLIARYGGEEFAVILPQTGTKLAWDIACTIAENVRYLTIAHTQSQIAEYVTISLGIATKIPEGNLESDDLIIRADRALYEAKSQGRNRAIIYPEN